MLPHSDIRVKLNRENAQCGRLTHSFSLQLNNFSSSLVYHCANFQLKRICGIWVLFYLLTNNQSQDVSINNQQTTRELTFKGMHEEINLTVFEMEKSTSVCSVIWKSVKAATWYLEQAREEKLKRGCWRLNKNVKDIQRRSNWVDDENYTPEMRNSLTRSWNT